MEDMPEHHVAAYACDLLFFWVRNLTPATTSIYATRSVQFRTTADVERTRMWQRPRKFAFSVSRPCRFRGLPLRRFVVARLVCSSAHICHVSSPAENPKSSISFFVGAKNKSSKSYWNHLKKQSLVQFKKLLN
jgi:hypothetical protein